MSDTKQAAGGGIGIVGILLVVFICAKVFEVVPVKDWSWWWVFSPLWIAAGLFVAMMVVVFIVLLIAELCK